MLKLKKILLESAIIENVQWNDKSFEYIFNSFNANELIYFYKLVHTKSEIKRFDYKLYDLN